MNLCIFVLCTLESIQIWLVSERNISKAVSNVSSPPLGVSLCVLVWHTSILTLGTAGLEDEVTASGPDTGCPVIESPQQISFCCPTDQSQGTKQAPAILNSISAPMLPPRLRLPVPLAKSSTLHEPRPKPHCLCKALLSHPRRRHLYQSFASEPQPACITIKLSCLACRLAEHLCK